MERILTPVGHTPVRGFESVRRLRPRRPRRIALLAACLAAATVSTAPAAAAAPLTPELAIPAPGGPGGEFGSSLALSADGSTALVGAPFDQGSGRITFYTRSDGDRVQQGPSFAGAGALGNCSHEVTEELEPCRFGFAVALSADGSTALVGAPRSRGNKGTVYVFERSGSTWAVTATLEPAEAARFGRSVALSADGDEALVGGPGVGRGAAAWVFKREAGEWTQDGAKLTPGEGGEEGEQFGFSVALAGDGETALVGSPGGEAHEGAAWPFTRTDGAWTRGAKLAAPPLTEGQEFGSSVALSADGTTGLVGAPAGLGRAGDASVFVRAGSVWTAQGPPLGSEEGVLTSKLGTSVALGGGGNIALLGAPGYEERRGEIREFARAGSRWFPRGSAWLGRSVERARFGSTVALSADATTALVGAPYFDAEAGSVWSLAEPFNERERFEPPPEEEGGSSGGGSGGNEQPTQPPTPPAKSGLAVLGTIAESSPTPVEDHSGNLSAGGGTVLVKIPGSTKFVTVTGVLNVPFGTTVDATNGAATVSTIGPTGQPQTITFSDGIFNLRSRGHGKVVAVLSGGSFTGCPTVKHRGKKADAAAAPTSHKHTVRKLWASGHGSYSTQGKYAAGAVQGTKWLTEDKCNGTLIVVLTDKVLVTNLLTHHKKLVTAHHSYFAAAP